jgi:hypothetical protein
MKFQKETLIICVIKMAPLKCGKGGELKWHRCPYLTITFVITIKDMPEDIPRQAVGERKGSLAEVNFHLEVSNK